MVTRSPVISISHQCRMASLPQNWRCRSLTSSASLNADINRSASNWLAPSTSSFTPPGSVMLTCCSSLIEFFCCLCRSGVCGVGVVVPGWPPDGGGLFDFGEPLGHGSEPFFDQDPGVAVADSSAANSHVCVAVVPVFGDRVCGELDDYDAFDFLVAFEHLEGRVGHQHLRPGPGQGVLHTFAVRDVAC